MVDSKENFHGDIWSEEEKLIAVATRSLHVPATELGYFIRVVIFPTNFVIPWKFRTVRFNF